MRALSSPATSTAMLLAAFFLAGIADASFYEPHLPAASPWFEGWYTRVSETTSGHSIGFILGHYPDQNLVNRTYVALIVDDGKAEPLVVEARPPSFKVSKNGAPIRGDPDQDSQPDFEVLGDGFAMTQRGDQQRVTLDFPNGVHFEANLSGRVPWGPRGESPEGWAGHLPIPLHWFVYSLASRATFRLAMPGLNISGQGKGHQEKNWGQSFPSTWIWAEGLQGENKIAVAGGSVPLGPVTVPNAYLIGLWTKKLTWTFHPQDPSVFWASVDACKGLVVLTARSANRKLRITLEAPPIGSGMFPVGGPTRTGFQIDSVENYRGKITVEAYSGLLHDRLEERLEIANAAIEFGGDARCKQTKEATEVPVVQAEATLAAAGPADTAIPEKRIRRELRALSEEERERVFAAMNVMKQTSSLKGQKMFGPQFISYDDLVAQHLKAAATKGCDEAHLGQAFATYHRAFVLRFEESLLAVDPKILALPYWDYNIEARRKDPRDSEIWRWFGSSEGDPSEGHAVKDGRFAHWRVRADAHEVANLSNPFNLLRSPWNVNPSPHITRSRYSCGSQTQFDARLWDLCLRAASFDEWYACIDPTIHTWAHSFLGGVWHTERNVSRVECFLTNAIGIPSAYSKGCLRCSSNCTDPAQAQKSCSCERSRELRCLADSFLARQAPTYGDFADAWTSPNDPIFFFHHANVDRHLMMWQQQHREKAPHYSFPSLSIPCQGHGLHDVVGASAPFSGSLLGLASNYTLTNADLIAIDGSRGPYTYDSLSRTLLRVQRPSALDWPSLRALLLGGVCFGTCILVFGFHVFHPLKVRRAPLALPSS
ncbi:unnamed protein product [Effrenium voratum]|uniref:Tyrosinase copper-binding domain-containing protein n=1 Tax=Effrenium voratum TaxID=2562239 RepID=A0AA36JK50_9DINO|nr:unnamed protein product [Effrenium voratum]CAJ1414716.1 unnamed protein product [Effrenium voratum]